MEYSRYIARKRARFNTACGPVNIPYGTVLKARDGFILANTTNEQLLCYTTGESAFEYFCQDDDGQGKERGALLNAILARLQSKNERDNCQARWDKVWGDALCQRYRRPEHEDHWIWSYDFYNAPVVDLWHIARLVGAKPKY